MSNFLEMNTPTTPTGRAPVVRTVSLTLTDDEDFATLAGLADFIEMVPL